MSPGIKNPFKKDLLRRQFDSCVLCYFTRHKDLFRDGTRHTGNGVANQFWWGFDGARKPEQWDGSRDTPAYASYRAGEAIAAYEAAIAAKDAELARALEALKELVSACTRYDEDEERSVLLTSNYCRAKDRAAALLAGGSDAS